MEDYEIHLRRARREAFGEAIERIQRMRDEAETGRKRIVLSNLFYRAGAPAHLTPDADPYSMSDKEVEATYTDEGCEAAFENFQSEDYEAYDGQTGVIEAFDRVLDVLQALAHGLTPAQGGS